MCDTMFGRTHNTLATKVLENTHSIAIMIFLLENPDCKKTQLYRAISSNSRMPDKLNELEDAGLVTQTCSDGLCVRLNLTDLGFGVATKLEDVEQMLITGVPQSDAFRCWLGFSGSISAFLPGKAGFRPIF